MENKKFVARVWDCQFRKHGMKTSIMARIMRLGLIAVVIVAATLTICMVTYSTTLLEREYNKEITNESTATAKSIEQWVTLVKTQIEAQSEKAELVATGTSLDKRKELLAAEAKKTKFKDFSISYVDGKTYNDTDISDRDYFKAAIAGTTYVSSPVLRKTDNSLTIMVGTPMKVTGFNGIIYGGLDVDFFDEQLGLLDLGEKGYGIILDSTGTVIADPHDNEYVSEQINPITKAKEDASFSEFAELAQIMISSPAGTSSLTMPDGELYLVGYSPVEGDEGWSIAVLLNINELQASTKKMITMGVVIFIGLLVLAFLIILLVGTNIAYPLRAAANRLKSLSEGDLTSDREDVKVPDDEVGRVIEGFDATQAMLKEYIGDIDMVLGNITKGNLDIEITKEYKGDFASIKDNLNKIIASLNGTFTKANDASSNLLEGARQVENASQALAQASTEQASAVVQITSSIENIAKSTADNTSDVIKVNDLTQKAKAEADAGNEQMNRMVEAMDEINEASQNISKIMKVIDDISFQTNILALNASVEAARAGVHGRGFAVVAEEVRSLAGKSSAAAGEIAEMIDDSIKKIQAGSVIATDTAEKLEAIVGEIDGIAEIMDRIAVVSKEQAEAVGQVNVGIEQISSAVQNNSATSEECAASSIELSNQAKGLADQIAYYKIK